MKIGERLSVETNETDHQLVLDDSNLRYLKQISVDGVMANVGQLPEGHHGSAEATPQAGSSYYWEARDLVQLKQRVERAGLELFGLAAYFPYEKLKRGLPGRDEELEYWARWIRNMGEAGLPIMQYGWTINAGAPCRNWRTSAGIRGRGDALMTGFDYESARKAPITALGQITDQQMWDGLAYFLRNIIPVAEEAGVRLALHPADPQVPSLAGIARIPRSVADYDRLFELAPSPSNAMTFCQGCFAQMLEPADLYTAIQHFASLDRIAFVHFRNVRGCIEKFEETWWDEGKVDSFQAAKTYFSSGFNGYLVTDHIPTAEGDTKWGHRARTFALAYMRATIQAAESVLRL